MPKSSKRRPPDRVINNLYEAKLHLSRLVDRATRGEEIIIAKNGKPLVKLVALPSRKKRVPGGWQGKVWEAPDCWEPMSEEELRLWYEGDIEPAS